jgi:hypothetical protein
VPRDQVGQVRQRRLGVPGRRVVAQHAQHLVELGDRVGSE